MPSPEPSEATEKRHAQEIADSNAARAKEVQELKAAHAKQIAHLKEVHAEQMAQRERTTVWLLFCGIMWGLGIALCAVIVEKLYFR